MCEVSSQVVFVQAPLCLPPRYLREKLQYVACAIVSSFQIPNKAQSSHSKKGILRFSPNRSVEDLCGLPSI